MVVMTMIMMDILTFLWNLVSILFLSIVAIMLAGGYDCRYIYQCQVVGIKMDCEKVVEARRW